MCIRDSLTTASLSLRLAMIAPRLKAATIGWQHNCYDGYLHVKPVVFWQQENLLQQYLPNLDRYIVSVSYTHLVLPSFLYPILWNRYSAFAIRP